MTKVTWMWLANNSLTGTLPKSFAAMTSMATFDVGTNQLSGTLPNEFSQWGPNVVQFLVRSNALSGTLPASYSNWTGILSFDIHSNAFSGELPPQYSEWLIMNHFTVQNNHFTGTLPPQFAAWNALLTFNAMVNSLTGTLPAEYQWGMVTQIILANNTVTGGIPSSWARTMKSLTVLLLSSNMLSGTLNFPESPAPFPSLYFLSISYNNFSGTLPSLAFLIALDAQDNPLLDGDLLGLPLVHEVSLCSTLVCNQSRPSFLPITFACVPPGAVTLLVEMNLPATDFFTAFVGLADKYNTSMTSKCLATRNAANGSTTTSVPSPNSTTVPEVDVLSHSAQSTASFAVGAAVASAATGIDAADAQMLVSILSSPCTCSATTTEESSASSSVLLIALSPFSPLGPSWTAIGNSLLVCVVVSVHALTMFAFEMKRSVRSKQSPSIISSMTLFGRWLSGRQGRRQVAFQLRFPNLSVSLLLLFIPGVIRAVTSVIASTAHTALDVSAIAVGVTFAVCVFVIAEQVIYRHVSNEVHSFQMHSTGTTGDEQKLLHFVVHRRLEKLFFPLIPFLHR